MPGFQRVSEHDTDAEQIIPYPSTGPAQAARQEGPGMAAEIMGIALGALSKRAVVAVSSLFTAAALLSVWWLFALCLPAPTVLQLVGLTIYGVFVLLLEFVRRR